MRHALLVLALLLCPGLAWGSVLSDAADAMAPDSWAVLGTNNLNSTTTFLDPGGASGFVTGDASRGCWDPVKQEAHFIGMDHNPGAPQRHLKYVASTNTWVRMADVPFGLGSVIHSWGAFGCDIRGRTIYRGMNNSLWRWNMTTEVWTQITTNFGVFDPSGFKGFAFFPERGSRGHLMIAGGTGTNTSAVIRYDPATDQFASVQSGVTDGIINSQFTQEYSDIHKVTLFSSGYQANTYRVSTRGVVTNVATTPCEIYSNRGGIVHADPTTGNFVVVCQYISGVANMSGWHIYHPVTNTWTTKPIATGVTNHIHNHASSAGAWDNWGVIGIPIWDHGVIMYIKCNNSECAVRLYRGGPFSTADRDFKARCAQPGVINCFGFDSANEVSSPSTTIEGVVRTTPGWSTPPALDATRKASGLSAIKFTVDSNTGDSAGGSYHENIRDDHSLQIGQGQDLYLQWRQRFNCAFLFLTCPGTWSVANARPFTGGNGWKQVIISEQERTGVQVFSCTDLEIVVQNTEHWGLPTMYHSCGTKDSQYEGLSEPIPATTDRYLQNNIRGGLGTDCRSHSPNFQLGAQSCAPYYADEWMTFQVRIRPGTPYNNTGNYAHDGIVDLWVAREGQPSVHVLRFDPAAGTGACQAQQVSLPACQTGYDFFNNNAAVRKYAAFWLLPYNTNKSASEAHPTGEVWYDEVVISSVQVADPGAAAPPPGTPPVAPTNLTVTP